ncbi:hypothetical protein AD006_32445 (plasmid) [Pseudonocardia sp. EC080610-09]|nr:hypothetical protein AD006_32445 [Pseudonocardia sp. EC080610-09]
MLDGLPLSVQLPAGTGKTHLLVDIVAQVAARRADIGDARKVLVLTHTNAGVQVIRRRLGAALSPLSHVATITSFAFEFARAYPQLGGITIPEHPDWDQSRDYLDAGTQVCRNRHVQQVLAASYSHLLVDEYQDCSQIHHELVCELHRAIPKTGVFGDPLQAIFGFDPKAPLVSWDQVQHEFPDHPVDLVPWRWQEHNLELGAWLLNLRASIRPGATLDLSDATTPLGVRFIQHDPKLTPLRTRLYQLTADPGTVLVLAGRSRTQTRTMAGRLGQRGYTAMEDLNGTFMHEQLAQLSHTSLSGRARWAAELAKTCFTGLSGLDKTVFKRFDTGRTASSLRRPGLGGVLAALDELVPAADLPTLAAALHRIARAGEGVLHSAEAWQDTAAAITAAAGSTTASTTPAELADELHRGLRAVRDRLRHHGTRERRRQISRTLLVKGLEYDHVVIANLAEIPDAHNLYVALTRARKSITIIGATPMITLTATKGTHLGGVEA